MSNSDGTNLVVINVYCPRVDRDKPERLDYKLKFFSAIEYRAKYFLQRGWYAIFSLHKSQNSIVYNI